MDFGDQIFGIIFSFWLVGWGEGLRQRGMEELRAEKDYVKGKTTIDENVFQV